MLESLRRHPIPIAAFFDFSLVLTYAFPKEMLQSLLPPGLIVDHHGEFGFVAIALVQTRGLRPAGFPSWIGRDFFLSGYRIFARYTRPNGQVLRGLRILRSDTDSLLMARAGNILTHYNYRHCEVASRRKGSRLSIDIKTPAGEADLSLRTDLSLEPATPPEGSPFPDWGIARRFAGPLPFTFDYEAPSHSLVIIQGVRENWAPRPISVEIGKAAFFDRPPFHGLPARLANAFFIERIPYRWERGVAETLPVVIP